MSRRESRDHHSKRTRSRFDEEPSLKKVRSDGKPATERTSSKGRDLDTRSAADHDEKRSQRLRDPLPLDVAPAIENSVQPETRKRNLDRKDDDLLDATKHASDKKEIPRSRDDKEIPLSRTYFQHDERDSTGHDARRSGRRAVEHGRWSDPKEQYSDRTRFKGETRDLKRKDDVTRSNADEKKEASEMKRKDDRIPSNADDKKAWKHDKFSELADDKKASKHDKFSELAGDQKAWKHDKFSELEAEVPRTRKRPAFSEKKMPAEPESTTAARLSEPTRTHGLADGTREERAPYQSHGMDKFDRPFNRVDERNGRRADGPLHRAEFPRPGYQSREKPRVGFTRGQEMADGGYNERSAYRPGVVRAEKWKHDLFEEANRSPTPKNEEDHIAKVEALLAL